MRKTIFLEPNLGSKLVWSVLIGYTIFVESTPFTLWLGGLLIVGSSSYIAWREKK